MVPVRTPDGKITHVTFGEAVGQDKAPDKKHWWNPNDGQDVNIKFLDEPPAPPKHATPGDTGYSMTKAYMDNCPYFKGGFQRSRPTKKCNSREYPEDLIHLVDLSNPEPTTGFPRGKLTVIVGGRQGMGQKTNLMMALAQQSRWGVTSTGRPESEPPAMQTIPIRDPKTADVRGRSAFADLFDRGVFDADYSAVEARILKLYDDQPPGPFEHLQKSVNSRLAARFKEKGE